MRSSKSRSRNKSNRQRSLGNIVNRVFDSSGPEGKVRGTPQQIIEKYLTLARDAQLSNDRVAEQSFLQHAEHYTRLLSEAQREQSERQQQFTSQRDDNSRDDQPDGGDQRNGHMNGNGGQNGHGRHEQSRDRSRGASSGRDDGQEGTGQPEADATAHEDGGQPSPSGARPASANPRSGGGRGRARPEEKSDEGAGEDAGGNWETHASDSGSTGRGLPPVISTDDGSGPVETPESASDDQAAVPGRDLPDAQDDAAQGADDAQDETPKPEARPATRRRTTRTTASAPRTRRKAEPKSDTGATKEPASEG